MIATTVASGLGCDEPAGPGVADASEQPRDAFATDANGAARDAASDSGGGADADVGAAQDSGQDAGSLADTRGDRAADPCSGLALCATAGWSCDGDVAVSCLEDENGCLVETRTDCTLEPGGYCSEAGVLPGCRQSEGPCDGLGTCPAPLYCEGDVLHTCLSDDEGCAVARGEQDCTREGKICDDSGAEPMCRVPDPSLVSNQIQAIRDAIDSAPSLPVSGDWEVDNALVTYVKGPQGNDVGGFFIQGERLGPAIFVVHVDPVGIVEVGDEVSIWLDEADLDQERRVVTGLGWLDIISQGSSVTGWVQELSAVDIVTDLDLYEFELATLRATVVGAFSSAGSGFVDAVIATEAVTGTTDLRLRIPTALSSDLLGGRDDLIGCDVSIGPTPLWRYLGRAQPSAFFASEVALSCL